MNRLLIQIDVLNIVRGHCLAPFTQLYLKKISPTLAFCQRNWSKNEDTKMLAIWWCQVLDKESLYRSDKYQQIYLRHATKHTLPAFKECRECLLRFDCYKVFSMHFICQFVQKVISKSLLKIACQRYGFSAWLFHVSGKI